jgi:hypothetical protein
MSDPYIEPSGGVSRPTGRRGQSIQDAPASGM